MEVYGQVNMMYACITVLRALALKEGPQTIWNDYTKFESHLEERMKSEVYTKVGRLCKYSCFVPFRYMKTLYIVNSVEFCLFILLNHVSNFITQVNKEKVVFFIQHYLKLLNKYSDLEILEACGKLDTCLLYTSDAADE